MSEWVLKSRYLLKNERGEVIETADELWRRVAGAVAAQSKNTATILPVDDGRRSFTG
jgi:ribonucleotide reductase alpha subunit